MRIFCVINYSCQSESHYCRRQQRSMEGEGDSRVHFSEVSDPWSSTRHVAVLQALNVVEKVCVSVCVCLPP